MTHAELTAMLKAYGEWLASGSERGKCADLTDADLPTIIAVPNLDAAILAAIEAGGTLDMSDWHRGGACGTTHCRAGWAITLAGEPGRVLQDMLGPSAAGALIYAASRPDKPIPNFFASTDEAMASIRADAAAVTA